MVDLDGNRMRFTRVTTELHTHPRYVRDNRRPRKGSHSHVDHITLAVVHEVVRSLVLAGEVELLSLQADQVRITAGSGIL